MTIDPHIKAIQDAIVHDHEATIAQAQRRADEATDPWYRKWHQDHADRLRAMHYPWERPAASA